jgi:hypothetical protein
MKLIKCLVIIVLCIPVTCMAVEASCDHIQPITIKGNQNIYRFVPKKTADTRILSEKKQKKYLTIFLQHFFSPWRKNGMQLLHKMFSDKNKRFEKDQLNNIAYYKQHLGFGENYQKHTKEWLNSIVANMSMLNFPNTDKNAITIDNTPMRYFPTIAPHFYNFKTVGQGYPFDNFQKSVILAGTPIHVYQVSKDGDWVFVESPALFGWVSVKNIAYVSDDFMQYWETENYVATIAKKHSIKDVQGTFRFQAYMGSVFPLIKENKNSYRIIVPAANASREAIVMEADVSKKYMQKMPLPSTPNNFAKLIKKLLGASYGWGGEYFYSDCSSTLKGLFAPFGIWLPRNSGAQANVGDKVDLSKLSARRRRNYILKKGVPFTTLIHVPGHIMLYIGEEKGKVMTFQNLWAFQTWARRGSKYCEGRAVVGKALVMPLELKYDRGMTPQIAVDKLDISSL